MIVLKTLTTAQNFKVIPRVYADEFTLSIRNERTNVKQKYEIKGTKKTEKN